MARHNGYKAIAAEHENEARLAEIILRDLSTEQVTPELDRGIVKKLLLLLILLCPFFGLAQQATGGYHRTNQVLMRGTNTITAQVAPYATVRVTVTGTGSGATIYSDPALSVPIASSSVTTDSNGNYGYYIPLNYCVTETISAPGQGSQVIPNVCANSSTAPSYPISIPLGGTGQNNAQGAATAVVDGNAINPSSIGQTGTPGPANFSTVAAANAISAVTPVIDIRNAAYGAKCDGSTDDRAAIGAAITAGGAYTVPVRIYIPDSTVCVIGSNPSPGGYIYTIPYNNIGFTGSGTIKIGNSLGNYRALFDFSGSPANVTIENLTIDGNAANNAVNSNPIGANEHIAFQINGGTAHNVTVQNVKFINGNDVQTVSLNLCNNCSIINNHWSNMGIGGTYDHDSSEIYLTGTGGIVEGNTFQAAGIGVRTAIEVHQDSKIVSGNVIQNYRACVATSANESVVHDLNVIGNTCSNVNRGVSIWATDGSYDGLNITGNIISVNRGANPWSVSNDESGVALFPASTYGLTNVHIENNNIRFVADTLATNSFSAGIALSGSNATPLANVSIIGNTIESPLCSGITIQPLSTVTDLDISGNHIHNPGQRNGSASSFCFSLWQSGITISTVTAWSGSVAENNVISDTQTTPTMVYGTYFLGASGDNAGSGLRFNGDDISYTGSPSSLTPYVVFSTSSPFFSVKVPNFSYSNPITLSMSSPNYPPHGSSIFDPISGRTYAQTVSGGTGVFFSSTETRQSIPSSGTGYQQGDFVRDALSAGTTYGWIYNGSSWVAVNNYIAPLTGTSSSIGGSSVPSGSNTSAAVTVTGATSGMNCVATATDGSAGPGYPFVVQAYGNGTNTVAVLVWNYGGTSATPTAKTYNVRCFQ